MSSLFRKATRAVAMIGLASVGFTTAGCNQGGGKGAVQLYGGEQGTPVAKVGDATITVESLEERLNKLNPYIRGRYKTDDRKKEYLDTMIRTELLAQEAIKLGLDKDSGVRDRIKNELAQKLIAQEFDGKMREKLVTDEDVKKYYDENFENYNKPELVRVSHIWFEAAKTDAKLYAAKKAEAEKLLKELAKKDKDDRQIFGELAKQHSADEKSKRIGGDLSYYSEKQLAEQWGPEFAAAAFANKDKTTLVEQVVATDKGFHLIKMRGRRDPVTKTFDQMKAPIRSRLYYERRTQALENWVNELKGKYAAQVFDDKIASVKVSDEAPAGGPGAPGAPGAPGSPFQFGQPPQMPGQAPAPGGAPAGEAAPAAPAAAPAAK
jgi:peptidyl-prolyl cis-trans isomerase C